MAEAEMMNMSSTALVAKSPLAESSGAVAVASTSSAAAAAPKRKSHHHRSRSSSRSSSPSPSPVPQARSAPLPKKEGPVFRPLANPGPLGLAAFGMTTALLNFRNCAAINETSAMTMVFAMGCFFGGAVQVIAGILEFVKNNTFGMVAFTSYGAFWLSFCFLNFFPKLGWAEAADPGSVAMYLFMWSIFTFGMFFASLKQRIHRCMQTLFITLTILFWILALENLLKQTSHEEAGKVIGKIAGVEGIGVGLLAIYMSMAELNEWPLFPMPKLEPKSLA